MHQALIWSSRPQWAPTGLQNTINHSHLSSPCCHLNSRAFLMLLCTCHTQYAWIAWKRMKGKKVMWTQLLYKDSMSLKSRRKATINKNIRKIKIRQWRRCLWVVVPLDQGCPNFFVWGSHTSKRKDKRAAQKRMTGREWPPGCYLVNLDLSDLICTKRSKLWTANTRFSLQEHMS